ECLLLDALGETDDRGPISQERLGLVKDLPEAVRGHAHDDDLGTVEGLLERGRGVQALRQLIVGQIITVDVRTGNGVSQVGAPRPLPVAVVCDDATVADWARQSGALVVWEPGRGLNGAVEAGVERLASAGAARVIVAHADLPLAGPLAWAGRFPGITLVPDRR